MLGIMFQKMWHKRWMNLCLLVGCILLVATVVSFPLYQKAAYDRMLQDEFRNYIAAEGKYPAVIPSKINAKNEKKGTTIKKMEKFQNSICDRLGVTPKDISRYYVVLGGSVKSDMNRSDASETVIPFGMMSGLSENISIVSGRMYSEDGRTDDGVIEAVISQNMMVKNGFLVGERLSFTSARDKEGNPIKVEITGVFVQDSENPYYWQNPHVEYQDAIFINEDLFLDEFTGDNAARYSLICYYKTSFEYEDISSEQVEHLIAQTNYLDKKSKYKGVIDEPVYMSILDEYSKKVNRISATLMILQIPVLIMLAAFLLMISGQMYEMEKNEISVIKSRGSSRGQIFRLYLYQGILLTIVGGIAGVLLGGIFSRILGSVSSFLDFDTSRALQIVYTKKSMITVAVSLLITLLTITLPAIKHSKVSIVNLKQSRASAKKALWQKLYLDIILLGISLYGYYSFNHNMKDVSGTVLAGQKLDPLLYISSSLFIVGMGLLYIRIQPLFIKVIYLIGRKNWKPASYITFMEMMKQSGKQQLIILFLIMTVSLGMYHSTVARTILDNALSNTEYNDGVDMILAEKWEEGVDENGTKTGVYIEPDYKKYASMDFADAYTRVMYDEYGYVSEGKNSNQRMTLMGIHTKEFGKMTYVTQDILPKHYYEYLNELAMEPKGVLLSENFRSLLGFDIGDTITLYNGHKEGAACKVIDFFEYWPGYAPTSTDIGPDGSAITKDNYLAVMNFDYTRQTYGVKPYQIWIDLKEDADTTSIYNWISDRDIKIAKYVNRDDDIEKTMEDPLLQGTNGVLTLGFVVTLILCAIGYIIYWIMSIRDRELIFGVLRASGFHKKEIVQMILLEQMFAGVMSVLAGIGIGWISSQMFVPIIQLSFASATQVLPLKLITEASDLVRLYGVIGGVMGICVAVLIMLLFRMNITKALKLGEE